MTAPLAWSDVDAAARLRDLGERWPDALVAWDLVAVDGLVIDERSGILFARNQRCGTLHAESCDCMVWICERWVALDVKNDERGDRR